MAVTNEKSVEYTNQTASPVVKLESNEFQGDVEIAHFDFTQGAAAGDAGSTADLIKMPGGKIRFLKIEFATSAFGASRVLKIGHEGYTDVDASTAVAADDDAFASALDLSSAADISDLVDVVIESFDGFDIRGTVTGGTIPAAATLKGYISYVRDAN